MAHLRFGVIDTEEPSWNDPGSASTSSRLCVIGCDSPPRSVTVLQAIEERLNEDLGDETEATIALTAKADPVLAELWDNPRDAECHRHSREIPGGRAADVGSA